MTGSLELTVIITTITKNPTFKIGTQYRQTGFAATGSGFYAHGTNMIDWVQTSVTEQNDSKYP